MDYRALLATVSVAAGIVLGTVAAVKAWRRRKPVAVFGVYGVLFFGVALLLWKGRAPHSLPAPVAEAPAFLTMPEPVVPVRVQPMPSVPFVRKKAKPAGPQEPDSMLPEWRLYRALSRAFDSLEVVIPRQNTPEIRPDSGAVPEPHSAGSTPHPTGDSPPRKRRTPV
ncbi:MAG TPA: hypothetical protein VGL38_02675 [bacterium]|jgi:hypothetical protein